MRPAPAPPPRPVPPARALTCPRASGDTYSAAVPAPSARARFAAVDAAASQRRRTALLALAHPDQQHASERRVGIRRGTCRPLAREVAALVRAAQRARRGRSSAASEAGRSPRGTSTASKRGLVLRRIGGNDAGFEGHGPLVLRSAVCGRRSGGAPPKVLEMLLYGSGVVAPGVGSVPDRAPARARGRSSRASGPLQKAGQRRRSAGPPPGKPRSDSNRHWPEARYDAPSPPPPPGPVRRWPWRPTAAQAASASRLAVGVRGSSPRYTGCPNPAGFFPPCASFSATPSARSDEPTSAEKPRHRRGVAAVLRSGQRTHRRGDTARQVGTRGRRDPGGDRCRD